MGKWMDSYLDKLNTNRDENLIGGGKDRIELQHSLGKLTARERIDLLADDGTFEEIGSVVRDAISFKEGDKIPSPADGVVMGFVKINGRDVAVYSMDFTVMSGSLGDQTSWKIAELIEMAGKMRIPLIGMIDSAGERLSLRGGHVGLHGLATLLRNYCLYSGVIPQIALVLGPCTGVMAEIPVLSDFLIMNRNTGFLWLGGEKNSEDAGDADFHMEKSGQCDIIVDSDEEAIEKAKELLNFIPQSCWDKPSLFDTGDDPNRMEADLVDVMPDDPKFTYDMHDIIERVVDNGDFFELKEDYAPHMIIGFCRFGGYSAGIVATNPEELSGIIEPDSGDKYDRFMNFLDTFNIPIINLVDTTAFPPGDRWERLGVIRHGAKLLQSYANLTCPKVTMVLRRSYGGANIVMGCSKMYPDLIYGWPTVEFAPTGPETIVHAVFHKELAKAKEEGKYDEVYNMYLSILKEQMNVMRMGKSFTSYYTVHEVIDPRQTRPRIVRALQALSNKKEILPDKKRVIKPA